jgi:type II secretory pathway component GspD/PulD (secretin)
MKNLKNILVLGIVGSVLSGCMQNIPKGENGQQYSELMRELQELKAQSETAQKNERIKITDGPLMTGKTIPLKRSPWLTEHRVTLKVTDPLNGHEVVKMLMAQGLNMTSSMPLNNFRYAGYGFSSVDAETALRLIFPAMGLDYVVDNDRRIITIVPMRPKQWTLNINSNRSTNYTSASLSGTLDVGASLAGALSSSGSGGGSGSPMGGLTSSSSGEDGGERDGSSKLESSSDFWKSMKDELESRVSVLVPVTGDSIVSGLVSSEAGMPINGMPALPMGQAMPSAPSVPAGGDMYRSQKLGTVSVNPDTGTITVQAPKWLQAEIDEYIRGVEREFNVAIHFEGRLILVSTTREKSEGLDLTAFASFANGELGMILNNNPAGGLTISPSIPGNGSPGVPPVISTGGDVIGSTGLGLSKLTGNPANLFVNYLSSIGDVSVTQRPAIATTSGAPAEFRRIETDLFSQVSQSAVAGTDSSSVATTNTQIPIRFGTLLRVNPKIDLESGVVRTQLTLNVAVRSQVKTIDQYITDANGTTKVPTQITLPANIDYNGEVLLRDGDTIIIGGQMETEKTGSGSGITGYESAGPLAGLIGSTKTQDRVSTYYFVLTAKVYERTPGA